MAEFVGPNMDDIVVHRLCCHPELSRATRIVFRREAAIERSLSKLSKMVAGEQTKIKPFSKLELEKKVKQACREETMIRNGAADCGKINTKLVHPSYQFNCIVEALTHMPIGSIQFVCSQTP
jgi:hypothetical protein